MSENSVDYSMILQELKHIIDNIPVKIHPQLDVFHDFTLPGDWDFKNRVNSCFHIAMVRSGSGSYMLGDNKESIEKGKLILVSPGFCHSRELDMESLPRAALGRFSLIDNMKMQPVNLHKKPFAFGLIPKDPSRFYSLFTTLGEYYSRGHRETGRKQCCNVLTQILLEIYEELYDLVFTIPNDIRIERAAAFMMQNLERDISGNELADICQLSKNYMRKCFYKQFGMNPKQYHIQLRINKALELLNETEYSIREIAELLGYSDPYSFSKQFKAVTGKSPTESKRHVVPLGRVWST
jgi:AraC-like DNA-binding protein